MLELRAAFSINEWREHKHSSTPMTQVKKQKYNFLKLWLLLCATALLSEKKKSNVCLGQYNLGVYLMVDDRHHF